MSGPGSDDESDDDRDERAAPPHDTDRGRSGADDAETTAPVDEDPPVGENGPPGEGTPADSDGERPERGQRAADTDEPTPFGSSRDDPHDSVTSPPDAVDVAELGPVETEGGGGPGTDVDAGTTQDSEGPPIPGGDEGREEFDGPVDWFLHTDDAFVVTVRDVGNSLLTVAFIGIVLFAVSGIWPPLVAVESGSMEPHMHRNDLVFIVEEGRFVGDSAQPGTGVVTHRAAQQNEGYWSFGDYGNVIVYQPNDDPQRVPIIHRARFWVAEDENWVDPPSEGGTGKADQQYLGGAESCSQVRTCPAPHDGFVTLGDANERYDQVGASMNSDVVEPDWVRGKAKVRVPLLGWIRLQFAQLATTFGGTGPTALGMLRLQLGVVLAGVGTVVARRRGVL
ncbi:S26 family signal peptidase [Haloarchaeobius baliensis]|uniref:S26 family signal peptidase n=1 Tax=Haloarchaeobius baliensis TaxID=1670458 RepID=UPI003F8858E7